MPESDSLIPTQINDPSPEELERWTSSFNKEAEEMLTPEAKQAADLAQAYSYLDQALANPNSDFGQETIKTFHSLLSQNIPGIGEHKGEYYLAPRNYKSYAPWKIKPFFPLSEKPEAMRKIGERYKDHMDFQPETPEDYVAVIQNAAEIMTQIEDVHPFFEGNGRTGRIVADSILMKGGLFQMPSWEDNRHDGELSGRSKFYWLVEQARTGNKKPLVHFMVERQIKAITEELEAIEADPLALNEAHTSKYWNRQIEKVTALGQYLGPQTK